MTLLPRPGVRTQRRLTRGMQTALAALVAAATLSIATGYEGWAGHSKVLVNGTVALAITALPALLRRNYRIPLDPWLGLWITSAVFLHALGSAWLYHGLWWWDHVTHALSASLVAGVGYTAMRALDHHSEGVELPDRYAFAFVVIFVLAFGVLWELFEYGLDQLAAATGLTMPLAQLGVADTVKDFAFNSLGAVLVGVFGQAHLTGLATHVQERLLARD